MVKRRVFLQEELNEPRIMSDPGTAVPASSVLFTSQFVPLRGSALSTGTTTILRVNTAMSSAPLSCLSALYPWENSKASAPNYTE